MSLTDTSILLSNYPSIQQQVPFEEVRGKNRLDILCGYDMTVDSREVTRQIANDLITAILTYDNVCIEGNHIWDVLQVFGSVYISELLRSNILHFIPDNLINPVMMKKSDQIWRPEFFPYASGVCNEKGDVVFQSVQEEWSEIETKFFHNGIKGEEAQALLYLIDEKKTVINQATIKELALKETLNDLKDERFVTDNSILRTNRLGLTEFHRLNVLRLHKLNTVVVTASLLGTNALKTDGHLRVLMNQKCASVFVTKFKDGVASIQSILHKKGFPDLGGLFVEHVIDLGDVLKLRNSIQGKLFRYWAMNDEYDENQMQMDIMNSVHTVLGSKISGAIRFLACSAIGVVSTISGVAASAFDSFILNKIAQGWHPNFFLDDKIKDTIDKCIKDKEDEAKEAVRKERFRGVGRNDPCPCGSGLKFKNCCGKN